MSPQTITLISGVVLLAVFALVGWNLRRRKRIRPEDQAVDAFDDVSE